MTQAAMTLTQFLIESRRRFPGATGELNSLLISVALACKSIATRVAEGALEPRQLQAIANDQFLRCVEWGGHVSAMSAQDVALPAVPEQGGGGKYLLLFDPLDGAPNVDVNVSVGSIFSILRAPDRAGGKDRTRAFLQNGTKQVAAGYAIYGPRTMLVITTGDGTHGFTLDRSIGEFLLTHRAMRVNEKAEEFAINSSNSRFWEPPIRRYVAECLAGTTGPRSRDFNMRWTASLVAEAHRILVRGGVFLSPRDRREPQCPGRVGLLHEANPIGFLVEQAGGRASNGRAPILAVAPTQLQQRIGFVFGSKEEVALIERYHAEDTGEPETDLPLFQTRGLFRDPLVA